MDWIVPAKSGFGYPTALYVRPGLLPDNGARPFQFPNHTGHSGW